MLGQSLVARIVFRAFLFVVVVLMTDVDVYGAGYLVDVTKFGAVADAKRVDGVWVGTDNSKAINKCAAYCRANGLTMFFPKGNYGVGSTIWLTNPDEDGLKQASITVIGSNRGAYRGQSTCANICVLKSFKPGRIVEVRKKNGVTKEPYIVPVLAISNARQAHIEGIGIQGSSKKDLICGIAIGNISKLTSIRYCDINNTYAGIVFPGLRPSANESVKEGNNDLLVVEQSTFDNAYNIVCAGTQPFSCEYRNSQFICTRSVFTGKLVTNFYGHSRGSHKFSSNLFGTGEDAVGQDTVYFDLHLNEITIDSCHFETGRSRNIPEVLVRQFPQGGAGTRRVRLSFTNNIVNFRNVDKNPSKHRPIIDTLTGNRIIFQGNNFSVGTAVRIKAYGAIFIGNVIRLNGPHDLQVNNEAQSLAGSAGNIKGGLYDFNHFIRSDSEVIVSLPNGKKLKKDVHYKVQKDMNAFGITEAGKAEIDAAKATHLLLSYRANDAAKVGFEAWGRNKFNAPYGWRSKDLTLIANKVIYKTDTGQVLESGLQTKSTHKLPTNK